VPRFEEEKSLDRDEKRKMTAEERKAFRLKQEESLFRDPALSMSWTGMNALSPHVHY
jgi:hypothetical protein